MITIAPAKPADAQAIRRLEMRIWGHEVVNRYDIPTFVRFGWAFVARVGRQLVGALYAYQTKRGDVYVSDVIVQANYRKHGVAHHLYRALIRSAGRRPIVALLDPRNAPTRALHRDLGFRVAGRLSSPYGLHEGVRLLVRRAGSKP